MLTHEVPDRGIEFNKMRVMRRKEYRKLRSFLGGDHANPKLLRDRGTYLSILRQKHMELKDEIAD